MNHTGFAFIVRYLSKGFSAKQTILLSAMVGCTLAPLLIVATILAAQDGCQSIFDATSKMYTTPTHVFYSSTSVPPSSRSKPVEGEVIYIGGIMYDNAGGKWARSQVTLQQAMKAAEEERRNGKMTCRYLRDESVNGEMATVYSTHSETIIPEIKTTIKSDGQVWISKTKGLPLRQEQDTEGVSGGKTHQSIRYEYSSVQAPRL